jgi:ABC-type uncharacterized transport system permease subunit
MNRYWRLVVAGVFLALVAGFTPAPAVFMALIAGFVAGLSTGRRDRG